MSPGGEAALQFHVSVFNRPEIIPAFFTDALKIAECLGCRLEFTDAFGGASPSPDQELWPVQTGDVADLRIRILGDRSEETLEGLRALMAQRFCEARYLVN
jgi:hypothetical protein